MTARCAKELDIFKQGPIWKSADAMKKGAPDDDTLIAKSGKKRIKTRECRICAQHPMGIVKPQTKCADTCARVAEIRCQDSERVGRQSRIGVKEQEYFSSCEPRTRVALGSSSAPGMDNTRTQSFCCVRSLIRATAVNYDQV